LKNSNLSLTEQPKIKWIEADINYSRVFIDGEFKPKLLSLTLKKVEESLNNSLFFRIHRMYLVNLARIEYIDKIKKTVTIEGIEFSISRRRYAAFIRHYTRYKLTQKGLANIQISNFPKEMPAPYYSRSN
jgi:DNA-binding LytR/AlgR family response regulator